MKNFKNLKVWRESHHLTLDIYQLTKTFPSEEKFGIISQMRRSSQSIPTNIAEGCGRYSDNELARFCQIALGSTTELEYQLLLSKDLNYINQNKYLELNNNINKIKAMLINLLSRIRNK